MGTLIAPFEALGRCLLGPIGRLADVGSRGTSPLRQPLAEWRDLLYLNCAVFAATLFLLCLSTFGFAGVGLIGTWVSGTHPAGRLYVTPFTFLELAFAGLGSIYAFRVTLTVNKAAQVMKESRQMRSAGDTPVQGDLLRNRFTRDYLRLHPKSWDVVAALALGVVAGTIAWLAN
jgi:hypothetical protein